MALVNFGDTGNPIAVFIKFEAVIARICNEDVTVLGKRQTLWTVQRITGTVYTLQIGAKPIENLRHIQISQLIRKILKWNENERRAETCTCILELPQSATRMLSNGSTVIPVGALNCPSPSPFEPKLYKKWPEGSNT